MADKASVYEAKDTVFVVDSHLKVMLEEDYLATSKTSNANLGTCSGPNNKERVPKHVAKRRRVECESAPGRQPIDKHPLLQYRP